MTRCWIDGEDFGDLLAEDVVIETPFAAPGRPARFAGREEFLTATADERATFPVRFTGVDNVVIHDTTDPQVVVVEYELHGVVTATGRRAAAPFIGVLRVRDGKVVRWREYQHTLGIAHALGRLPDLAAALAGSG
ncbi:nuclear transport factor 2 family protein [Sphaerisporangium rufum]|nr:nuclear transport factor 2 family protein [Sphaerisporangium rufum]